MDRVWLVARREYFYTVRRKGFIITTLGMPIFFALIAGIGGGAAALALRSGGQEERVFGIIDESGLIKFELLHRVQTSIQSELQERDDVDPVFRGLRTRGIKEFEGIRFQSLASREKGQSAYQRKEIRGYYIVPSNFLDSGLIELETKKTGLLSEDRPGWGVVQGLLEASLVEGVLENKRARRLWLRPRLKSTTLTEGGQTDAGGDYSMVTDFAVPYTFTILFLLSIMCSAGYLLQGVAEEKENRVLEILLSSVSAGQLLAGKVLGLCAAGLTQIGIWSVMVITPAIVMLPFLNLRWSQLVIAIVFFLLGFLLFGTLMAGFGSLGSNMKESQQMSILWTMVAISPVFFMAALLAQPNGMIARVLSFIPLTAPLTIIIRTSAAQVPVWEIVLSAAILFASLFIFIRLATKMFRLGVLMYGKRPSVGEIVRWLKAA